MNAYSKQILFKDSSYILNTFSRSVLARVAIEGCKSSNWLLSTAKSRVSSLLKRNTLGNE